MKIKLRFGRRYSVFITIAACAAAVVMMVKNFGLEPQAVLEFALIIVILLLALVVVAAPLAFALRWLVNRRNQ
jgi:Flp pilus assembly protein TadB